MLLFRKMQIYLYRQTWRGHSRVNSRQIGGFGGCVALCATLTGRVACYTCGQFAALCWGFVKDKPER